MTNIKVCQVSAKHVPFLPPHLSAGRALPLAALALAQVPPALPPPLTAALAEELLVAGELAGGQGGSKREHSSDKVSIR